MNTYEFVFEGGTRMQGEGNDLAEAILDAYHRNGFLPISKLVEKIWLNEPLPSPEQSKPPEYRRSKR
jgi:hypothetical protein